MLLNAMFMFLLFYLILIILQCFTTSYLSNTNYFHLAITMLKRDIRERNILQLVREIRWKEKKYKIIIPCIISALVSLYHVQPIYRSLYAIYNQYIDFFKNFVPSNTPKLKRKKIGVKLWNGPSSVFHYASFLFLQIKSWNNFNFLSLHSLSIPS